MFEGRVWLSVLFILAMCAGWALSGFAQYDEIDVGRNLVNVGFDGAGDHTSLSVTAVAPISQFDDRFSGWLGGFAQQQTTDGAITAQTLNAHAQVGWRFLNAFGDWTRDKLRGISSQSQVGGFVSAPRFRYAGVGFTAGAGNFLENKQTQADLEVKETDPNVVRWLIYCRASYSNYAALVKLTPALDGADMQASFEPRARYALSDRLAVVLSGIFGYESEPLTDSSVYSSYQAQLSAEF